MVESRSSPTGAPVACEAPPKVIAIATASSAIIALSDSVATAADITTALRSLVGPLEELTIVGVIAWFRAAPEEAAGVLALLGNLARHRVETTLARGATSGSGGALSRETRWRTEGPRATRKATVTPASAHSASSVPRGFVTPLEEAAIRGILALLRAAEEGPALVHTFFAHRALRRG